MKRSLLTRCWLQRPLHLQASAMHPCPCERAGPGRPTLRSRLCVPRGCIAWSCQVLLSRMERRCMPSVAAAGRCSQQVAGHVGQAGGCIVQPCQKFLSHAKWGAWEPGPGPSAPFSSCACSSCSRSCTSSGMLCSLAALRLARNLQHALVSLGCTAQEALQQAGQAEEKGSNPHRGCSTGWSAWACTAQPARQQVLRQLVSCCLAAHWLCCTMRCTRAHSLARSGRGGPVGRPCTPRTREGHMRSPASLAGRHLRMASLFRVRIFSRALLSGPAAALVALLAEPGAVTSDTPQTGPQAAWICSGAVAGCAGHCRLPPAGSGSAIMAIMPVMPWTGPTMGAGSSGCCCCQGP